MSFSLLNLVYSFHNIFNISLFCLCPSTGGTEKRHLSRDECVWKGEASNIHGNQDRVNAEYVVIGVNVCMYFL